MIKRLSKQKIIIVNIYIIYSILFILSINLIKEVEFAKWIKLIAYLIILNYVIIFLFFKRLKIKIYSFSGIFLTLSFLFHFGQTILLGIFLNYKFVNFNFKDIITNEIYIKTINFSIIAIMFLVL